MLAHEARCAIVINDELQRLVEPAVSTITVPVLMSALLEGDGGSIVEADHESGRLNGLKGLPVLSTTLEQDLTSVGPHVTVLTGEDTNRRCRLCLLIDLAELLL